MCRHLDGSKKIISFGWAGEGEWKDCSVVTDQPRSQLLLSPHPKEGERRKTLVQAGHMPPKRWQKKQREGDVT